MMWFKSCSRCQQGDMTLDEDGDRLCLQCGHVERSAGPAVVAGFADLVDTAVAPTESGSSDAARREVTLAV